ncbi:cutinase family protein [Streptomyces sp. S.PB5]|uniref:cutinase family protein n=1 Tax=Streptomyces sp. S.PB5 TaxID=3020844 RepID=UPI0025AEFA1B|nr:cutinase family protein [Streptomyces sp. S.PB5]MDN3021587.1 cutinase family protein [Streptomyces sp. S.PB5]
MHGLNEDHTSPMVHSVWEHYLDAMHKRGQSANAIFLAHPKRTGVDFWDWLHGKPVDENPVEQGIEALDDMVDHTNKLCSPARLVLVGYSAGAWSVDVWLRNASPALKSQVVGVVLLGDPQWYDEKYGNRGLAHLFGFGFDPKKDPYIPPEWMSRIQSWCVSGDPVCGTGYGTSASEAARQAADAATMLVTRKCTTHCAYIPEATRHGGRFLADLSTR